MFSSMIRRVAAMQLLRFRTTSMFWATKSAGSKGKSERACPGQYAYHSTLRFPLLTDPPVSTNLRMGEAESTCIRPVPGSERRPLRSSACWEPSYRLLMISCRGRQRVQWSLELWGRGEGGTPKTQVPASPLAALLVLASVHFAQNGVEKRS